MPQNDLSLELEIDLMRPQMYKVILHNDDYSTFDFVIEVLVEVFNKSNDEAVELTFKVDEEGFAVVGIYPKDIAETKVSLVKFMADEAKYPLLATMEKE
jgi:ATP-dependent Clp protease adaptor protein ClpS